MASESLRDETPPRFCNNFTDQDINEIRLLLRGDSIIDWHRLDLTHISEVHRLLRLNGFDHDDPRDQERIAFLRTSATDYIINTLKLRIDPAVASEIEFPEILLLASAEGTLQRNACLLLKVMHVINHLQARELRTKLAISDNELFSIVEESVVKMFDELRKAGVPVIEFSWSRKSNASLITKLLIKRRNIAARIFDRLRFRLIVAEDKDIEPTLQVILRKCIPFNYIVPAETVNSLVDIDRVSQLTDDPPPTTAPQRSAETSTDDSPSACNEFSGNDFRILNFIADLPVRVDEILQSDSNYVIENGRITFVLAEFQLLDRATAERNEAGESSHKLYKQRQHNRVKERLLRIPSGSKSTLT